jgi:hypothetical protein
MTARGFFILGDDGLPQSFVDTDHFEKREQRLSSLIAAHSRDPAAVLAITKAELMGTGESAEMRALLACGVLYELATGVLAPFMSLAEQAYPKNDYVGDLLTLSDQINQSLQGDAHEGDPPSEGDTHVSNT